MVSSLLKLQNVHFFSGFMKSGISLGFCIHDLNFEMFYIGETGNKFQIESNRIKSCSFSCLLFWLEMYDVEKEWIIAECKEHGPRSVNH